MVCLSTIYLDILNQHHVVFLFLLVSIALEISSSVKDNFKVSAKQIENAITEKTKMFMFSSPCNPSGSVYTENELREIAKVFEKHPQIFIVSDEIYEHINFTNQHFSIGRIDSLKDRVITVNGVSKGFAMTGWRVGFIGAPLWIAKACNKIQGQVTSATCAISQKATEEAMKADPKEVTSEMKNSFLKRRDLLLEKLNGIKGVKCNIPDGAFYIFPDISYFFGKTDGKNVINDANDLCMYLLNTCYVALVSGAPFGNPECVRISYAASEENLLEAVKRIKSQLEKLY